MAKGYVAWALLIACSAAGAQARFPPEEVKKGAALYSQNCAPCHGDHMQDPQGAFDLRTFPRDDKPRFVISVTKGKNSMPPWGDLFKPEDVDALWAYVLTGDK